MSFAGAGDVRRFLAEVRERHGHAPAFELSYLMSRPFLEEVAFLKGSVASAHAPCPRAEHFPNLGSRDPEVVGESLSTIRDSAAAAAALGAGTLVLHPGYATDAAVPSDSRRRLAALGPEGGIGGPGTCESRVYRRHFDAAIANLRRAGAACAGLGVRLAVENLNPRVTYLFQLPEELVLLASEVPEVVLCVDLAHLWISSLVHGFGFADGLLRILATGRVVTTHVHDNDSRLEPSRRLADDHAAIGTGRVPIRQALPLLAAAGVRTLVVESLGPALESYSALVALIREDP